MEDAYPIAAGELVAEAGGGFLIPHKGAEQGSFLVQTLYGLFPNAQLEIGSRLFTAPRERQGLEASGNISIETLYNFNQETLDIPATAVKLGVLAPTGTDSEGVEVEIKGILTKSLGRLSLHANAAYEFAPEAEPGVRDGRYEFIVGASYPLGAPHYTRLTLLADAYAQQTERFGQRVLVGAELGFRFQLSPRFVWDAGIASEFRGPNTRSDFALTTGLSLSF